MKICWYGDLLAARSNLVTTDPNWRRERDPNVNLKARESVVLL